MPDEAIPPRVWRTVVCSFGLLTIGLAMFISGLVLWRTEGDSALIALFVLGALVFIPGFYFTRIAYKVWKGHRGYTWEDIPEWSYQG